MIIVWAMRMTIQDVPPKDRERSVGKHDMGQQPEITDLMQIGGIAII